jgi:hypothetical protein
MSDRIVIAGNNVRNVVESAFKSGYKVYAVTKFVDADLQLYSERVFEIEEENERWISKKIDEIAETYSCPVILTSGLEDLKIKSEVLGSDPSKLEKVVNKEKFYRVLEKNGLPYPEIFDPSSDGLNEDCIIKPVKGGGGEDITRCKSGDVPIENFLIQRFIDGDPCSISLMVGERIVPIAPNLIIAGWREMNSSGFRYTGNITPLNSPPEIIRELERISVEVCELFDLGGSVGVDFVVDKEGKPYILEINPRFQGSLDSIEWSTDVNLFKLHIDTTTGKKIERPKIKRIAGRFILFAKKRIEITSEVVGNPFFADIPKKGVIYEKDDPITSILASGQRIEEIKRKAVERKNVFLKLQHR